MLNKYNLIGCIFLLCGIVFFLIRFSKSSDGNTNSATQDFTVEEASITEIHQAIKSGKIAEKLTDPNEIKAILGEPQREERARSGGMLLLNMYFPIM